MNFTRTLTESQSAPGGSLLCVGLDPDPARFPQAWRGDSRRIYDFCAAIVDATRDLVCAFKPQIAYFAAQRAEEQLERLVEHIHRSAPGVPVILDAKRGDVGSTAEQYAREAFDRYRADAVTLSPLMGFDSIEPFMRHEGKGLILLCRTSNAGGDELQSRRIEAGPADGVDSTDRALPFEPLYQRIARLAAGSWNRHGQLGLVVGATYPDELARVRALAPTLPLLVPGIGGPGRRCRGHRARRLAPRCAASGQQLAGGAVCRRRRGRWQRFCGCGAGGGRGHAHAAGAGAAARLKTARRRERHAGPLRRAKPVRGRWRCVRRPSGDAARHAARHPAPDLRRHTGHAAGGSYALDRRHRLRRCGLADCGRVVAHGPGSCAGDGFRRAGRRGCVRHPPAPAAAGWRADCLAGDGDRVAGAGGRDPAARPGHAWTAGGLAAGMRTVRSGRLARRRVAGRGGGRGAGDGGDGGAAAGRHGRGRRARTGQPPDRHRRRAGCRRADLAG